MDCDQAEQFIRLLEATKVYGIGGLVLLFIVFGWVPFCTGLNILFRGGKV